MHDEDFTTILRRGDTAAPLPEDVADAIRAEMHHELDRVLDPTSTVVSLRTAPTPARSRPRRWMWIAASVLLVAGATAVFLTGTTSDDVAEPAATGPAVTAGDISPAPATERFLVACSTFIDSTQFDGTPWEEHFTLDDPTSSPPSAADFDRLAQAIDVLMASAPGVEPAIEFLELAVIEARKPDPDMATLVGHLELAQNAFQRTFRLSCLSFGSAE